MNEKEKDCNKATNEYIFRIGNKPDENASEEAKKIYELSKEVEAAEEKSCQDYIKEAKREVVIDKIKNIAALSIGVLGQIICVTIVYFSLLYLLSYSVNYVILHLPK